jgi:DNA-3-methyladenine glycosylase I
MDDLVTGADDVTRCAWSAGDDLYRAYHDEEWGQHQSGDDAMFELLTLEGFQAGLSWITILRKRAGFRSAFADFRIAEVAAFGEHDIDRLLADVGIVRHRGKIEAAVGNARAALALPSGLSDLVWSFAPEAPRSRPSRLAQIPVTTPEATALSKELKRQGFRFVGPTTMYALMQAAGLVDDHLAGCAAAGTVARPT